MIFFKSIVESLNPKQVIKLKSNMMNIWQLFKNLPRDLQWEVLSEFVGSHAVRKGKLMRKMVFDTRHKVIQNIQPIRECNIWLYTNDFKARTIVYMGEGSQLMFCDDPKYGATRILFRKRNKRTHSRETKSYGHFFTPINDSVTLPPFEKHVYPSYEYTDKKKGIQIKPLRLMYPSEDKEVIIQPKSPDGPPPPMTPDGPPPPRSPDGPPPR
jgi:hypothetical protein